MTRSRTWPKIWVVIPTVHGPRVGNLVEKLFAASDSPNGLIILDNHPGADDCGFGVMPHGDSIIVLNRPALLGSTAAFRIAIEEAVKRGAEWVWCLDDDMTLSANAYSQVSIATRQHAGERVLLATNINGSRSGQVVLGHTLSHLNPVPAGGEPQLAPWSGLVIGQPDRFLEGFHVISDKYWFSWDDYALVYWATHCQGYVLRSTDAVVGHPESVRRNWKCYYESRNGVIFAITMLAGAPKVLFLLRFLARYVLVGGLKRGLLVQRVHGFISGLVGIRGPTRVPR